MVRSRLGLSAFVLSICLAASAPARAGRPPRLSVGGGAGYPHIFHGDVSLWLVPYLTVDARIWSMALLPRSGAEATLTVHVPIGRFAALATAGGGIWREIPETPYGLATDAKNDSYVRAAAGVGWMNHLLDLRATAGVTTRPTGHSITIIVTVMTRFPRG